MTAFAIGTLLVVLAALASVAYLLFRMRRLNTVANRNFETAAFIRQTRDVLRRSGIAIEHVLTGTHSNEERLKMALELLPVVLTEVDELIARYRQLVSAGKMRPTDSVLENLICTRGILQDAYDKLTSKIGQPA